MNDEFRITNGDVRRFYFSARVCDRLEAPSGHGAASQSEIHPLFQSFCAPETEFKSGCGWAELSFDSSGVCC
jgi:hypothetical protein